jgi:hypothetical protein
MNMMIFGVSGNFNNGVYFKVLFNHLQILALLDGFQLSPSVMLGVDYINVGVNQGKYFMSLMDCMYGKNELLLSSIVYLDIIRSYLMPLIIFFVGFINHGLFRIMKVYKVNF